jgi:hypothetical protein
LNEGRYRECNNNNNNNGGGVGGGAINDGTFI